MKIRKFKIKNLAILARLQEELPKKYGSEIEDILERLITKTHSLHVYNLSDYIVAIMHLSKRYPELKELLPSAEQVDEFLKERESRGRRAENGSEEVEEFLRPRAGGAKKNGEEA